MGGVTSEQRNGLQKIIIIWKVNSVCGRILICEKNLLERNQFKKEKIFETKVVWKINAVCKTKGVFKLK